MASASCRIPDPSPNLLRGDEPGDQAEAERRFARAEFHAAGFWLKSWHFSRIPKTSSASRFPPSCWEERSSLPEEQSRWEPNAIPCSVAGDLGHHMDRKKLDLSCKPRKKRPDSPEHP